MWTLPIVTNGTTNDVPAPLNGWIVESLNRWCDEERGVIFPALSVTLGKRGLWRKGETRGSWDYTRPYHVISQQGRDGEGWGNHLDLYHTHHVHQGCHNPQNQSTKYVTKSEFSAPLLLLTAHGEHSHLRISRAYFHNSFARLFLSLDILQRYAIQFEYLYHNYIVDFPGVCWCIFQFQLPMSVIQSWTEWQAHARIPLWNRHVAGKS